MEVTPQGSGKWEELFGLIEKVGHFVLALCAAGAGVIEIRRLERRFERSNHTSPL
jgi:hypothetical protein